MLAERARLRVDKGSKQPIEVKRSIGVVQRNPGEKDLHSLVESVKRKMNRDKPTGRKRSRR